MANSGASFWGLKKRVAAGIRAGHNHDLGCEQSCNHHKRRATIQTECADQSGHYFGNRDCCNARARAVLQRVEECGIPASWH